MDAGSVMVRGAGIQPRAPQAAGCFLGTAYKVSIVLLKTARGLRSKGSAESVSARDEGIF